MGPGISAAIVRIGELSEGGEEAGEVAREEGGDIETEAGELDAFDDAVGAGLTVDVLAAPQFEPIELGVEEADDDVLADAGAAVHVLL